MKLNNIFCGGIGLVAFLLSISGVLASLSLSCTKEILTDKQTVTPKSLLKNKIRSYKDNPSYFHVSEEDVELYCQYIERLKDQDSYGKTLGVEPIYFEEEIVAYAINFERGWQIVSSDKRGPIVLAKSGKGLFLYDAANDNVKTWLDMLFEDIAYRRSFADDYYNYLDEDGVESETFSLALWNAILNDHFEESGSLETKLPPLIPPGDYQYSYTYTTTEYDTLSHLMTTHWHQNNPYNTYIPLASSSGTTRCPAGCTTIAGAQVLYYLHNYLGKPVSSPSIGYCNGTYNGYSSSFSNFYPYTWGVMDTALDTDDYRGLLIGHVAYSAHVVFDPDGSSADIKNLKDYTFPFYGVAGNYSTTYNRDTVYNNLKDNLPVIFGGNRYEDLFHYPGHTWVIDGYVDEVTIYHDVYEWQYLTEPTVPAPTYPPVERTYRSPQLKYFKMNWGWGNSGPYYEDDATYSTSGSWVNPRHPNYNPYSHDKEIYSRFR